ncbi:hypothetical protein NDU88_005457 [Pleurodeles waltl]|uniref:Uncharacterized protein n=1 Tax=Pleurodeles waltl TaxID=8319 RepID=A0AAV7L4X1_PLEWA|nr:hypothetical protein NDU88_005457 [Pleurodeles waltl]
MDYPAGAPPPDEARITHLANVGGTWPPLKVSVVTSERVQPGCARAWFAPSAAAPVPVANGPLRRTPCPGPRNLLSGPRRSTIPERGLAWSSVRRACREIL